MSRVGACIVVVYLIASANAVVAYEPTLDTWGFSMPPDLPEVGETLELVAVVAKTTTLLPWSLDFDNNEYTVRVTGLQLATVINNGPLLEMHYNGGRTILFADPLFNAPFDADTDESQVPALNPAVVPSHFEDGIVVLDFVFNSCITLWYESAGLGSFAFTATDLTCVGGTHKSDLEELDLLTGWHMGGGFTNDASAQIPDGYSMRYDFLLRHPLPSPVESATWGRIKASFGE